MGHGAFGRHHASKYARLPGVELVGIADPCPNARRQATAVHGVPAASDWRDLLGAVDVVSVCSPAVTHAPIVRAFLNAGTDVLVEKPIAVDLDEADTLIALAEMKGRVLTVGHQERFVFARTGLLDYAEAPLQLDFWRMGPWTGRGQDVSAVLDLMIHDLDLAHCLIPGEIENVAARGRSGASRRSDDVTALVTFENGAQSHLHASRISPIRRRGMRAIYADGVVDIDFVTRQVKNTTPRPLNRLELDDPLGESIAAFVEAARMGGESLVRPKEARRALETALMIEDAAAPRTSLSEPIALYA